MQLKHTLPACFSSLTTQMKPSLLLSVSVQTFVVSISSTAVPSSYYLQKTLELCFVLFEFFCFVFLTCFIQLPLGIASSYSIFIFADVFLSHSVFDFSGPPYFGPGFIFALCCRLCVHK